MWRRRSLEGGFIPQGVALRVWTTLNSGTEVDGLRLRSFDQFGPAAEFASGYGADGAQVG